MRNEADFLQASFHDSHEMASHAGRKPGAARKAPELKPKKLLGRMAFMRQLLAEL